MTRRGEAFCIDGDRLTDLLIEHGIGVRREAVEVLSFDEMGLYGEGVT